MVIKIDLNFLPRNFKTFIVQDIDREYLNHYNLKTHTDAVNDLDGKDISPRIDKKQDIITIESKKSNSQEIELMIKDILIKRRIRDYVVIQDAEEDKIVILKREHGELLGIYHCRHCGMAFEDEIQLSTHLRMHYLI